MVPPRRDGGVTNDVVGQSACALKRSLALLGGVAEEGGVSGMNERSEVARGIDDGELLVRLDGRLLLSEVGGEEDGGVIGSCTLRWGKVKGKASSSSSSKGS